MHEKSGIRLTQEPSLQSTLCKCGRKSYLKKTAICQYHYKLSVQERNKVKGKICTIEVCQRGVWSKGFCNKHYLSRRRTSYDGNLYEIEGNTVRVFTFTSFFLIDLQDKDLVLTYRWNTDRRRNKAYPYTSINKKRVRLHTFLSGKTQDHINRQPWDNRRSNLRDCSISQNNINQSIRKDNTSGYKGVSPLRGKWQASLQHGGYQRYLGVFITKEEAALAYNKAALELFGDFAYLNVLEELRAELGQHPKSP